MTSLEPQVKKGLLKVRITCKFYSVTPINLVRVLRGALYSSRVPFRLNLELGRLTLGKRVASVKLELSSYSG